METTQDTSTHEILDRRSLEFKWTGPDRFLKDGIFFSPTYPQCSIHMDDTKTIHFKMRGIEYATVDTTFEPCVAEINYVVNNATSDGSYGLMFPHPQFPCLTTINCTRSIEFDETLSNLRMKEDGEAIVVGTLAFSVAAMT